MKLNTFKEYLETNATGYEKFIAKATKYQQLKNKARSPKNRWPEKKVERAINAMWDQVVQAAYEKIKQQKGRAHAGSEQIWIQFMNENDFLELFNESLDEIEFE